MNRETIEQLLRKAPDITPPRDLLATLKRDVTLPRAGMEVDQPTHRNPWLKRWLPAFGFAVWFLGCVVVFGYQASRINELSRQQTTSGEGHGAASHDDRGVEAATRGGIGAGQTGQTQRELDEIAGLRVEIERLRKELAELATLKSENARLRSELASRAIPAVKPEDDFFAAQQGKASRILCINNIKQLCLAARMEANDRNSDTLAKETSSLKPYASSEKIFFCGDGKAAYQLASPGASVRDANIVFVRCLNHNNVGLVDGSAHQLSADRKFVETERGLRLER